MKKAVCISIFNHYDNRVRFAEEFLRSHGYEVTYITSNYDHYTKDFYKLERENCIQIDSRPYTKNISVQRLYSHYLSSKKTYDVLCEIKPDLIYVLAPPNSQVGICAKYRRRNKKTVLLVDIFDVWPETFPSLAGKIAFKPLFLIWRAVRDSGLPAADYIITECGLFRKKLERQLSGRNSKILHLCKASESYNQITSLSVSPLNICYLGAINNIIDITAIEEILYGISLLKPIVLHIIGGGENVDALCALENHANISVRYYGMLYDEEEKHKIFDVCAFGLNIMKKSVCIGLTMKSVDYFEAGLPLINNIESDTSWIVDRYGAGFNYNGNPSSFAEKICSCDEYMLLSMRYNTRKAFDEMFSQKIYNERFQMLFDELELSASQDV